MWNICHQTMPLQLHLQEEKLIKINNKNNKMNIVFMQENL